MVVKDKNILITGGSNGIGRLMCLEFAERGGKVIAWGRKQKALDALEEEGRGRGLFIKGMVCDVSDREAVYRQAGILMKEYGPVDVLINNAGIVSGKTFLETPDEKMLQTMNVNTLAHFWTGKAFLPSMLERNSGHIVTIASAAGIVGVQGLADYNASKFAAFGFNESLRMELRRLKSPVRTTIVCPFFIDTGMFDGVKTRFPFLFPILKQEYVARRIVKAVLKNRKRLVMPPAIYSVFLGRLLPIGAFDALVDFLGINKAMDAFTGRR
ncbi:MAG: SDR family oxidoreductase [Treponema sp.]|jgi:all-trans-retinol dehydrogenase (NAD+)|nr:SDR family oxidoreductase [Treponema sp.]